MVVVKECKDLIMGTRKGIERCVVVCVETIVFERVFVLKWVMWVVGHFHKQNVLRVNRDWNLEGMGKWVASSANVVFAEDIKGFVSMREWLVGGNDLVAPQERHLFPVYNALGIRDTFYKAFRVCQTA